jgi:DNA mismatch repair protein MutS2
MKRKNKLEEKLEFEQILQSIKDYCISSSAKSIVDKIKFNHSKNFIERELGLVEEFLGIIMSNKQYPAEDYFDMSEELVRIKLPGTFISQMALFDLWRSLKTINSWIKFLSHQQENLPLLASLSQNIEIDEEILRNCKSILSDDGEILDNASDELYVIRVSIRRKQSEVEKRIRKLLNHSKQQGWTPTDAELTIRNGRPVIPITSANKRRLQGFVHDESSTGQTSYIEPAEVVELNNELRELEFAQAREIVRILTHFTETLRPFIDTLLLAYKFLIRIDFIAAKAKYAYKIKAGKPILKTESKEFIWYEARHPLLEEALKINHKEIVPLKIELNEKNRILIISGPNAGGKSVCLKTVGLLQYMLQCGILVPMKQTSEVILFDRIFIDMGDEQSIENDLSTYSSHLLNMKNLTEKADEKCLFLIDECGTGTDPSIGGAIAEAVLEDLEAKGAYGIVTTHYSNLKLLAEKHETIINGAMLFDTTNMKPLFQLSIGKPGSSFAFEIAKTIGLSSKIIESASNKIGQGFMNFEQSLQQLEVDKLEIKQKQEVIKLQDDLLNDLVNQYNAKLAEIKQKEKEIIYQAKAQAKEILQGANKQIENTIEKIKTAKAEKQTTQKLRQDLQQEVKTIEKDLQELEPELQVVEQIENPHTNIPFDSSSLSVGDVVLLENGNNYAFVKEIRRNKVEVECGEMLLSIPITKVKKVNKQIYLKQQKNKKNVKTKNLAINTIFEDINAIRAKFSYQLDLRGCRADEALDKLSKHIDQARLLGERELSILHGKGDGILKTVIRNYLKENSEVESYKAAAVEFGGEGITQIKLN